MAIAIDANSNGAQGSGTSLNWNHATSGDDRFLVVFGHQVNTAAVTCKYNGVTMTSLGTTGTIGMWYIANPASGTNQVLCTWSGTQFMRFGSSSYTGVDQDDPINTSANYTPGSVSSITATLTTDVEDCWLLIGAHGQSTVTASTNTVNRHQPGGDGANRFGDSNAARAAGASSVRMNGGGTATMYGKAIAIAPVPVVAGGFMIMF